MKISWVLPCAALLAAAPFAQCDNNRPDDNSGHTAISNSSVTAAAGAPNSAATAPKLEWVKTTSQSHPMKAAGVPNFGKLNDNVWRSGQPSEAGYKLLVNQGLKTVVNLRSEFPQDKDLIPPGVKYIYIPIRDEHAPTMEQAQEFIKAVSDASNWPLLVHCQAGQGRAGTMAALVRCSLDNWDAAAVMKETNAFRKAAVFGIKPPMANCQRSFIQDWQATVEAAARKEVTQADKAAN